MPVRSTASLLSNNQWPSSELGFLVITSSILINKDGGMLVMLSSPLLLLFTGSLNNHLAPHHQNSWKKSVLSMPAKFSLETLSTGLPLARSLASQLRISFLSNQQHGLTMPILSTHQHLSSVAQEAHQLSQYSLALTLIQYLVNNSALQSQIQEPLQ